MENNTESKTRFFALYWGQEVGRNSTYTDDVWPINSRMFRDSHPDDYLSLRSIESLTDEERKDLAGILSVFPEDVVDWITGDINNEDFNHPYNFLQATDYLRSIGIALPFMGVSVEKMIEWGWVKIKDNVFQP